MMDRDELKNETRRRGQIRQLLTQVALEPDINNRPPMYREIARLAMSAAHAAIEAAAKR
jgi:hypothetical protein